jgi:hypothetical protein
VSRPASSGYLTASTLVVVFVFILVIIAGAGTAVLVVVIVIAVHDPVKVGVCDTDQGKEAVFALILQPVIILVVVGTRLAIVLDWSADGVDGNARICGAVRVVAQKAGSRSNRAGLRARRPARIGVISRENGDGERQ